MQTYQGLVSGGTPLELKDRGEEQVGEILLNTGGKEKAGFDLLGFSL